MKLRCLIIFLTILTFTLPSRADYNFTYYRLGDGICDEYILDIFRDSNGFMWFCTSNGLDRFDGNDFVHYGVLAPVREHRTFSNYFRAVAEDGSGYLWAISDAGLSRISLYDWTIIQVTEAGGKNLPALSGKAFALSMTDDGHLWVSYENEILCLTLDKNGSISRYRAVSTPGKKSVTLCRQGNTMWAGGDYGLSRFTIADDGQIVALPLERSHPLNNVSGVRVIAIHGSYLHIGTRNEGLYSFDIRSENLEQFRHNPKNHDSLSSDNVSAISINASGDIIVGTGDGISIIAPGNRIKRLRHNPDSMSINDNIVNCIYVDSADNIWAGTTFGGVNLISRHDIRVSSIFDGKVITCIHQDSDGTLYAGTHRDGLGILYPGAAGPIYYKHDDTDTASIASDEITSVGTDTAGNIWIGTRSNGLDLLEARDKPRPRFTHFTAGSSNLSDNRIRDLVTDTVKNGMWICMENGIDFLDVTNREFHPLREFTGEDIRIGSMQTAILDSNYRLWAGGDNLLIVDLKSQGKARYSIYGYKFDDPESLIKERVSSIFEAGDGSVYIGSQYNGLYRAEPGSGVNPVFTNYPLVFGTKIHDIVDAGNNRIWICSVDAVYYYEPETYKSQKYDVTDGLPPGRFCIKSGIRLNDGSVCMGTTDGATVISPPLHYNTPGDRRVTITYVRTNNRTITPGSDGTYDLYPDDSFIEIGVSAQEYISPGKVLYAYKFKEIETVWNVEPQVRRVKYNTMKPGDYTFTIHCTNADNRWSDIETELRFNIHAPFYRTAWFYCIIAAIIVIALFIVTHTYTTRQRSLQRTLLNKVQQRTKKLTLQTEKLKQQNIEIQQQKLKLEELSHQIEKADKEKLMLFTSLTHEFKTPLSLILGPLKSIKKANDPNLTENISIIDRNARHLLSLVNQIIDMRKVDSGMLKPTEDTIDIVSAFNEDVSAFDNLFAERNITFESVVRVKTPVVTNDRGFLQKIIFNLISNAIKHTPDGGRITARLAQWGNGKSLSQYLSVSNTGSYISPEETDKIFDCFYKIENQSTYTCYGQSSTGIGLFLVKHIVDVMGGKISIRSHPATGTTFRICFPVSPKETHNTHDVENRSETGELPIPVTAVEDIPFSKPAKNDKPLLLLVEDSRDMRTYIRQLLDDRYYIAEAANGKRGYALAHEIVPDFIISDIMMPECDGFEFCSLIRSDPELCHIPFLMLTALSDDGFRFKSYKSGIDAYLTKPFDPEMLLARIDAVLINRRSQQKLISNNLGYLYPSIEIEGPDKIFLKRLMTIVGEHYSDPDFGARDLVKLMSMSAHSLYNKINALTGLPPTTFIRRYRLKTAQRIIDDNRGKKGINVSEIAYLVGFNDPKYFTRCFVKEFGIQPRIYINGTDTTTSS